MTYTEKSRVLKEWNLSSYRDLFYPPINAIVGGPYGSTINLYSKQITRSEGHPWPKAKGVADVGGPFDTIKLEYRNDMLARGKSIYERVNGPFIEHNAHDPLPYEGGIPSAFMSPALNFDDMCLYVHGGSLGRNLDPIGTKFIASTLPTNPVVDGAVSLAELYREGIPDLIGVSLLKGKVDFFRSLGGEYLNYQFGWLPLVSSIKDAAKAITESHQLLQQLAADSGKNIYRKRTSQPDLSTSVYDSRAEYPYGVGGADTTEPPWYRVTDTTRTETWFSGCYTYQYEPTKASNLERIVQEASLLYGLELTPEVLWNLAPWSWLVDWVVDVGPVVHNLSAFQQDGLVIRYGYVMEKTTHTINRRNLISPQSYARIPHAFDDSFIGTRKRRVKATPYGFGLTFDGFTNRQWSILAALGMSRKRGSLP
jgi:hypothetical protein